jgi:hypothetical protein
VASIGGWLAAVARADGDPASDVLASQRLFLPQDAGVTANQQAQLGALLTTAERSGYSARVALIASQADLGSVTALWRMPQNYARFLGQELALLYHGPVLIVMPNGYGLYQASGTPTAGQSALAGADRPGSELGKAALTAVQLIAAAAGHPLPIQQTNAPPPPRSSDTIAWLVFAIGAALVALAWAASLRAQPLRTHGPTPGTPP